MSGNGNGMFFWDIGEFKPGFSLSLSSLHKIDANHVSSQDKRIILKNKGKHVFDVGYSMDFGRYLSSKKGFDTEDDVFVEKPIIFCPSSINLEALKPDKFLCFGCNKIIDLDGCLYCIRCRWYACSKECIREPWHTLFECPMFFKRRIAPSYEALKYVYLVRTLQMKEKYMPGWSKIMNLSSCVDYEDDTFRANLIRDVDESYVFLNRKCDIRVDEELLIKLIKIFAINAFRLNHQDQMGNSYNGWALFSTSSLMHHSCHPNVKWAFLPLNEDDIEDRWRLVLTAIRQIKIGQPVSISYNDSLSPTTLERRKELAEHFHFQCRCERCSDRSELGTNYSGIICFNCEDIMLPVDPLNPDTDWECTNCETRLAKIIVDRLLQKYNWDLEDALRMNNKLGMLDEIDEMIAKCHDKYHLHENHSLVIHANIFWVTYMDLSLLLRMAPEVDILYTTLLERSKRCARIVGKLGIVYDWVRFQAIIAKVLIKYRLKSRTYRSIEVYRYTEKEKLNLLRRIMKYLARALRGVVNNLHDRRLFMMYQPLIKTYRFYREHLSIAHGLFDIDDKAFDLACAITRPTGRRSISVDYVIVTNDNPIKIYQRPSRLDTASEETDSISDKESEGVLKVTKRCFNLNKAARKERYIPEVKVKPKIALTKDDRKAHVLTTGGCHDFFKPKEKPKDDLTESKKVDQKPLSKQEKKLKKAAEKEEKKLKKAAEKEEKKAKIAAKKEAKKAKKAADEEEKKAKNAANNNDQEFWYFSEELPKKYYTERTTKLFLTLEQQALVYGGKKKPLVFQKPKPKSNGMEYKEPRTFADQLMCLLPSLEEYGIPDYIPSEAYLHPPLVLYPDRLPPPPPKKVRPPPKKVRPPPKKVIPPPPSKKVRQPSSDYIVSEYNLGVLFGDGRYPSSSFIVNPPTPSEPRKSALKQSNIIGGAAVNVRRKPKKVTFEGVPTQSSTDSEDDSTLSSIDDEDDQTPSFIDSEDDSTPKIAEAKSGDESIDIDVNDNVKRKSVPGFSFNRKYAQRKQQVFKDHVKANIEAIKNDPKLRKLPMKKCIKPTPLIIKDYIQANISAIKNDTKLRKLPTKFVATKLHPMPITTSIIQDPTPKSKAIIQDLLSKTLAIKESPKSKTFTTKQFPKSKAMATKQYSKSKAFAINMDPESRPWVIKQGLILKSEAIKEYQESKTLATKQYSKSKTLATKQYSKSKTKAIKENPKSNPLAIKQDLKSKSVAVKLDHKSKTLPIQHDPKSKTLATKQEQKSKSKTLVSKQEQNAKSKTLATKQEQNAKSKTLAIKQDPKSKVLAIKKVQESEKLAINPDRESQTLAIKQGTKSKASALAINPDQESQTWGIKQNLESQTWAIKQSPKWKALAIKQNPKSKALAIKQDLKSKTWAIEQNPKPKALVNKPVSKSESKAIRKFLKSVLLPLDRDPKPFKVDPKSIPMLGKEDLKSKIINAMKQERLS